MDRRAELAIRVSARVLGATAVGAGALPAADAIYQAVNNRTPLVEAQGRICDVGITAHGKNFIDSFPQNGQGRAHLLDKNIDQETGPTGDFTVHAINVRGQEIGKVVVGPDGTARLNGMKQECNTTGPNGQPALHFEAYAVDNRPGRLDPITPDRNQRISLVAENRNRAVAVFGREVAAAQAPAAPTIIAPRPEPTVITAPAPVIVIPDAIALKGVDGNQIQTNNYNNEGFLWDPFSRIAAGLAVAGGLIGGAAILAGAWGRSVAKINRELPYLTGRTDRVPVHPEGRDWMERWMGWGRRRVDEECFETIYDPITGEQTVRRVEPRGRRGHQPAPVVRNEQPAPEPAEAEATAARTRAEEARARVEQVEREEAQRQAAVPTIPVVQAPQEIRHTHNVHFDNLLGLGGNVGVRGNIETTREQVQRRVRGQQPPAQS